ncbi:MAG: dihydroneopterin aldolase [Tannerella sp.]|jgi:dihydroneopterin aldolase|nr:dihydroneopterin aldolase [Tannerella sp.]
MIATLELRDMRFFARHGVLPQERAVGNHYRVSLKWELPVDALLASDDPADAVDYAEVYALVKEQMDIPSRLIEHVAGRILAALRGRFPQIVAAEVSLSKQSPPIPGAELDCATVTLRC